MTTRKVFVGEFASCSGIPGAKELKDWMFQPIGRCMSDHYQGVKKATAAAAGGFGGGCGSGEGE